MKKKNNNPPIVTHAMMVRIIALLDYCYRAGVEAAHLTDDDGLAREFLERTQAAGVYGIFSDTPIYTDWQEWMLRIMAQVRTKSWDGILHQFFARVGKFGLNYMSVILPITLMYYRKGIEDYTGAPGANEFAVFQKKQRVRWRKDGLKLVNMRRWVDEVQLMTFDLTRRDLEVWQTESAYDARKIALTAKQYESFRRVIGLAMINET